jgi:hypothetical protein
VLPAGPKAHEVADHNLPDRHVSGRPSAYHGRVGCHECGQVIERALRADLLKRPDRDVRGRDPEKQRVAPGREHHRENPNTSRIPFGTVTTLARMMLA